MANPQTEDGYTRLANELIEALIAFDLTGREFRLALLVMRKTYGYGKKDDFISLTIMQRMTKIDRISCSQVINSLQRKKVITVSEDANGIGKKYKFNKNYEEWVTVSTNANCKQKRSLTVSEDTNGGLVKTRNDSIYKQKKILKKYTKESTVSEDANGIPYQEIIQYLNEKSGCSYRPNTQKNKDLINTRWNEGFRVDDFKKVIDNKTTTWLHDPKMNKFIRPETLFGNKFEGYLNERIGLADRGIVSSRTEKNMSTITNWMNKNKEGVKIA